MTLKKMGKETPKAPAQEEIMKEYREGAKKEPEKHMAKLLAQLSSYIARNTESVAQRRIAWEKAGKKPEDDPFVRNFNEALSVFNVYAKVAGMEPQEFKRQFEEDVARNKKLPADHPDEWKNMKAMAEKLLNAAFSFESKTLANVAFVHTLIPDREIPRPVVQGGTKFYLFKKLPGEEGDTRLTIYLSGACRVVVNGGAAKTYLPPFPDIFFNS